MVLSVSPGMTLYETAGSLRVCPESDLSARRAPQQGGAQAGMTL